MELNSHPNFENFLNEETIKFINIEDIQSDSSLGEVDIDNLSGKKIVSRIKTLVKSDTINTIIDKALIEANYSTNKSPGNDILDRVNSLFKKTINTESDEWFKNIQTKFESPFDVKLKSGTILSFNEIESFFGESFYDYDKMWNNLGTFKPGRPAMGPGEVILILFTTIKNALGNGDLRLRNANIELKGEAGALKAGESNKGTNTFSDGVAKIEEYLKVNKLPKLSTTTKTYFTSGKAWGRKTISDIGLSLFTDLKKIQGKAKNKIKVLDDICNFLPLYPIDTLPSDTGKVLNDLIAKKQYTELGHFMTLIDLIAYKKIEKFEYLLLTTINSKGYDKEKTFYFIDVNTKSFKDLWDKTYNKLTFVRIRYQGDKTEIDGIPQGW